MLAFPEWPLSVQPQWIPALNGAHPLYRDLALVVVGVPGVGYIDLVTGAIAKDTTAGQSEDYLYRHNGSSITPKSGGHQRFEIGQTRMDKIAGPWSIFVEGFSTTPASPRTLGYIVNSDEPGAGNGFGLFFDPLVIALTNGFRCFSEASARSMSSDQALGADGVYTPQRFMMSADGTNMNAYAKGKLDNSSADSTLPVANANRRTKLFARYDTATTASTPAAFSLLVVANRAWQLAEYKMLYENCWDLFAPPRVFIAANTVGGGGGGGFQAAWANANVVIY